MRKVVVKLLLFLVIILAIVLAVFCVTNNIVAKKANFKLPQNINKIVIGNSHPECALNDSLILDFKNIAHSGESYFYTIPKVENVLLQNKNIKVVFIEFGDLQLRTSTLKWIYDAEFLSRNYPDFGPFLNWKSNKEILVNNFKGFANVLSLVLRTNVSKIYLNDNNNYDKKLGGYLYLSRVYKNNTLPKTTKKSNSDNDEFYTGNIKLLRELIAKCKQLNTKVYIIRCPTHKKYHRNDSNVNLKQIVAQNFPDDEFLDFKDFPINDHEFADLEHLNYKGAKKFSKWFDWALQNGLLDAEDKQKFINTNMTIKFD